MKAILGSSGGLDEDGKGDSATITFNFNHPASLCEITITHPGFEIARIKVDRNELVRILSLC